MLDSPIVKMMIKKVDNKVDFKELIKNNSIHIEQNIELNCITLHLRNDKNEILKELHFNKLSEFMELVTKLNE